MKGEQIQIGLRLSEIVDEKISKVAKEVGTSKNSAILMLVDIGIKVRDKGFIFSAK
jgi:hypothetical protein